MNQPFLRTALMWAIRVYQRHLSPLKGFSCAYRVHTGCASCSALGYRAIRRYGSVAGLVVLNRRLGRCGEVHRQVHPPRPINYQRGECDAGCVPDCGNPCELAGDCMDCKDCKDLFKRKRRNEWAPEPRERRPRPRANR